MPTVTLAYLRQRVYDGLDNNTVFFTTDQVDRAINQGLRRLNVIVGFIQDTVPYPGFTIAGQSLYDTPDGILAPLRVYCEGRELEKLTLTELGQAYRSWAVDTTATKGPTARWAPIGLSRFVIHPIDAVGGNFLETQGIVPMTPLVADDDVMSLEDPWLDLIVRYAQARVLLKDSAQTFAQASLIYQQWISTLKNFTAWSGMRWPAYWYIKELNVTEKNAKVV